MRYHKKAVSPEIVGNLVTMLQRNIGGNVLVFGASNVTLAEELLRTERQITIIDIREKAFEKFRPQSHRVDLRLVTEHDEFRGLPPTFDTIVFYDTLHHVDDKATKIAQCQALLRTGGSLVIYEPNIVSKLTREYDQFGVLKNSMYKRTLIRLLKNHGFSVQLFSAEQLASRSRLLRPWIVRMQKTTIDPTFRILLLATKLRQPA